MKETLWWYRLQAVIECKKFKIIIVFISKSPEFPKFLNSECETFKIVLKLQLKVKSVVQNHCCGVQWQNNHNCVTSNPTHLTEMSRTLVVTVCRTTNVLLIVSYSSALSFHQL